MMKKYIYILTILIFTSSSCVKSDEDFKVLEGKMVSYIQNDEWDKLFEVIKKEDIPKGFNVEQKKRLEELSIEIVVKYKDFKLKESIGRKDTIMYGFVLNSSSQDFQDRIKELRKEFEGGFEWGSYSFRNPVFEYKYTLNGYQQHFMGEGIECDLIINKNEGKEVKSIRIHNSNCTPDMKSFKMLLSSNYGSYLDIPSSSYGYDDLIKKSYNMNIIYLKIKYDIFNVYEFYFLSNKEIFLYTKYNSTDEIIFNKNFVILKDIISPRFITYEQFFIEYEQKLKEVKKELEKSEKKVF